MRRSIPVLLLSCSLITSLRPAVALASEEPPEVDADDPEATAEGPSQAFEAKVAEAAAAFDEGDYDRSAELLKEAYEFEPDPALLYNIARVYEEAARNADAVEYYTRFVETPEVSLELKGKAAERLEVLRKIVAATSVEESPAETPEPQPEAERPQAPVEPPRPHRPLRVAGYTMLGVGLAAVAGGVTAGVLASGDSDDLSSEADPAARRELVDQGETKALVADVLIIGGSAIATTGLVLAIVGEVRKKRAGESRVALTPLWTPRQLGVGLSARF